MRTHDTSRYAGPHDLRKQAQIAQLHALQISDPGRRLFFLQVAQNFERLAERAERIIPAKVAP